MRGNHMAMNAGKEKYDVVDVDGRLCLFTNMRLDRNTIPPGLHCYDVRDSDFLDGSFCEIKPFVMVNHWGTINSREVFELDKHGSYYPKEEPGFVDMHLSLKEYEEVSMEELCQSLSAQGMQINL